MSARRRSAATTDPRPRGPWAGGRTHQGSRAGRQGAARQGRRGRGRGSERPAERRPERNLPHGPGFGRAPGRRPQSPRTIASFSRSFSRLSRARRTESGSGRRSSEAISPSIIRWRVLSASRCGLVIPMPFPGRPARLAGGRIWKLSTPGGLRQSPHMWRLRRASAPTAGGAFGMPALRVAPA